MCRLWVSLLLVAVMLFTLATPVFAATSTELQLYMGIKPKYVWKDPAAEAVSIDEINPEAGNPKAGTVGYTFTTKDSDELVAQALSSNNPVVTDGFIRQVPMRDLVKILATVKSAADILKERNRDDLLAKAYAGGYIAPEHTVVSTDPTGVGGVVTGGDKPYWAATGDIGAIGDKFPVPLAGKVTLLSVYGEPYVIGSNSFDMAETVFDTTKENPVFALINGYVSYIGDNTIELVSYDQQVTVRYRGVRGLDGTVAGSVFSQGTQIGTTMDFTLGVSLRVGTVQRNLLQAYSEAVSKEWFNVWSTKYATRVKQLVLNEGDFNYHLTAQELPANKASSYINPDDFGVKPTTVTPQ